MGVSNDVQLGPGLLYVAPVGTAEPTSASAALATAWREIGFTEEGSQFTYELSSEDVFVAEEFDPIRVATTSRTATLAFQMAEVTRRNLALALNVGANEADDGTWFEPPDVGSEVRVMIVHEPEEPASRWIFRQCFQTGSIEMSRKKAPDKALIPVEFKLEKPTGLRSFRVYPDADGRI